MQFEEHGVQKMVLASRKSASGSDTLVHEFAIIGIGDLDAERSRQIEMRRHGILPVLVVLELIISNDAIMELMRNVLLAHKQPNIDKLLLVLLLLGVLPHKIIEQCAENETVCT